MSWLVLSSQLLLERLVILVMPEASWFMFVDEDYGVPDRNLVELVYCVWFIIIFLPNPDHDI